MRAPKCPVHPWQAQHEPSAPSWGCGRDWGWGHRGTGARGCARGPGVRRVPAVLGLQSPEPLTLCWAAAVPRCRLEPWQGPQLSN